MNDVVLMFLAADDEKQNFAPEKAYYPVPTRSSSLWTTPSEFEGTRRFREPQNISAMDAECGAGSCLGWAARDPSGFLSPYRFSRRVVGGDDVSLRITHCGVCYADVAWTRNALHNSIYPCHEIVGVVTEIGSNVKGFKVGDHVGVGTYVDSCRDCEYCNDFLEVHCSKGSIGTFNSIDVDGTVTKGDIQATL
uniref:Alcohol dehydrogenase-like N-terminal domain-containing protein n=1 Tax=Ananas comosus var. bracteatus TaxID=296719 RepID=A0A6V7QK82_ANACO|nr:unnamed protein product [Ananas comosus var. bracteatus]